MKTIHHIPKIIELFENPQEFIGQRSFKLFRAYLLSYDLHLGPEIPESHQDFLNNYPDIQEECEALYNLDLGTRHWSSLLKYYCEDDRALFNIGVKFILDYDKKYPNPDNIHYPYERKNLAISFDLLNNLGHIGYRPEMYFGTSELACLRAFLDGYFSMKEECHMDLSEFEAKLLDFIDQFKVANNEKFRTWDRNYRWKWDFAVYGSNEKYAIPRFMSDVECFTGAELKITINNTVVKVDWTDHSSWSKSANELIEENKV